MDLCRDKELEFVIFSIAIMLFVLFNVNKLSLVCSCAIYLSITSTSVQKRRSMRRDTESIHPWVWKW